MAMEFFSDKMAIFIKVNGKMIKFTGMENIQQKMEIYMMDNGKMITDMVKVLFIEFKY